MIENDQFFEIYVSLFFRTIQLYEKSNAPAQIYLISEYHSFLLLFIIDKHYPAFYLCGI